MSLPKVVSSTTKIRFQDSLFNTLSDRYHPAVCGAKPVSVYPALRPSSLGQTSTDAADDAGLHTFCGGQPEWAHQGPAEAPDAARYVDLVRWSSSCQW